MTDSDGWFAEGTVYHVGEKVVLAGVECEITPPWEPLISRAMSWRTEEPRKHVSDAAWDAAVAQGANENIAHGLRETYEAFHRRAGVMAVTVEEWDAWTETWATNRQAETELTALREQLAQRDEQLAHAFEREVTIANLRAELERLRKVLSEPRDNDLCDGCGQRLEQCNARWDERRRQEKALLTLAPMDPKFGTPR